MITIEKLSLFNIDSFRKLYNEDYRSYICDKGFFTLYDNESFILRYLLRRQIRLFKFNNKYIGYIWYDESKKCSTNSIYSIYVLEEYINFFDSTSLSFVKCSTLKFDIEENENIKKLMNKLGFVISSNVCLMKLKLPLKLIEVNKELEFRHFVKNYDENLRCALQNNIFYSENRVPLEPDDIFEEEKQDYYINDFSVFLCNKDNYIGYGQIILSNGLYTIVNFGIIEEYRCQGYGQALLNYLIKLCQINSINDIYIRVENNNHKAVSLYNKIGFRECASYYTWYKCIS